MMTTTAPLNIFQRLMRKWEAVHPYNAAQVLLIQGQPDQPALSRAWNEALASTGLGRVRVASGGYAFERVELNELAFPDACLSAHISSELNRPFDDPSALPFRPFVIGHIDRFYAGVVYQHWIADSTSIRMLLREWFVRVFDPASASRQPLRLQRHGYWNTIGPNRSGWDVLGSTLGMIRRHTRLRRAQKIDSTALADHRTRFELFNAPGGLINQLRAAATSRGVKVNDLFLAALAEACAMHVPLQRRRNRVDVAIGSIVDLRPFTRDDLSTVFGMFLGFTNVVCQPNELADFEHLLQVVAAQTRIQKSTGVAPASLIWMSAATSIGKLSRPDELYHFYRKELPLAGGISNVDMSHSWAARYPSVLLDYIRVSPSGPMTPVVITTTTLGDHFHVGLTHRVGLIPPERAAALAHQFLARLGSLRA
jgi:hypothetical protein